MRAVDVVIDVENAFSHDVSIVYKPPRINRFGAQPLADWDLDRPNIANQPNAATTVWNLLAPQTPHGEGGERPSKRRKVDTSINGYIGLQTVEDFEESRSIVLTKADITLQFPNVSTEQIQACDGLTARPAPSVVILEQFSRLTDTKARFTLWNAQGSVSGLDVIVTANPKSIDSIFAPLTAISGDLRISLNGKTRSVKPGASFYRCVLHPPSPGRTSFRLEAEVRWSVGVSVVESAPATNPIAQRDMSIFNMFLPADSNHSQLARSLADFYDSVHVPPNDHPVSQRIVKSLQATPLYPFQQRAVDWLLRREGVAFSSTGNLEPLMKTVPTPPASFLRMTDALGSSCYVSHARGMIVSDISTINHYSPDVIRGGILAEEMGLGKTVEMIALMSHHKRKAAENDIFDDNTGAFVAPSGATLIITPPSILEQWKKEINAHAPELKVLHYQGLPPVTAPKRAHAEATAQHLMQFDVVLTTYAVLSREVHFATPPPNRSLRGEKRHPPRRSPLVQISWWRVCLDEAQMVESGVSQAARVARLIPRCNAWAVSGTPLAKDIADLRGLLMFLRYEPFASCKPVWNSLDKSSFRALFSEITLRHSKERIRDELRLPPQKRVVITVPFTAIEEQNYSEMIRQMCDACGLSPEGFPVGEGRDADDPEVIERMREWLVRLRQTCLHAHVGRRNRRALGAKNGPLRTVHEVLEVMIEQNDTQLKAEAREYILAQVRCGHVKGNAGDVETRSEQALPFYKEALNDVQQYVASCRDELLLEKEKLGTAAPEGDDGKEPDSDEEDLEAQNLGRIPVIRKTLRSFLEVEHACNFFIGTAHFQIKSNENLTKPESDEFHRLEKLEVEWYDKAKKIRKELLRESQGRAQLQMKKIRAATPFFQIPEITELADLGGIESKKILEMMDNVSDVLNAQASQLAKWRQKVVDILLLPLVDEDEGKETTGDEYEDSTKVQDELYVYIMALRTLVADRNGAVNGLQDLLIEHELKEAEKLARRPEEDGFRGHAPELLLEVIETRRRIKPTAEQGSLKGVVSAVRSLITSLQWRADGGDQRAQTELSIAQKQFSEIQKVTNEQTKAITELEKEQELFRAAMNQRLEFYRQLQHISDTVAPWKEELDPEFDGPEFARQLTRKEQSSVKLGGCKTKHTYLTNLRRENQQADVRHECIICRDVFEIGVLTTCGHKYCKECINHWWHAHRTCPLCKVKLHTSDFKDINFKPNEVRAQEETHDQGSASEGSSPSSTNVSIYSDISDSTMREIKTIELDGSYGTKVDMIARHLLWIRHNDPGAKSIIFSQFGDFLEVLREALRKWKIGCSGIKDREGIHRFIGDPAVECFLLDAKSDSSGLNLVNATYVFLCEPLINPAIELQAIARVHRIGQQRSTTVFMYLVSDTVEEAIYEISVSRRLDHMGRGSSSSGTTTPLLKEQTIDAANSLEMQAAPLKRLLRKKGDGEIVQVDDLWSCLFSKPRKQQRAVVDKEVGRHLRAEAAQSRVALAGS